MRKADRGEFCPVNTTFSTRHGVPVYAVATNEQLAEMVRKPVTSLTALQKVPGFGKAKVERYGESFVELLNSQLPVLQEGRDSDSSDPG